MSRQTIVIVTLIVVLCAAAAASLFYGGTGTLAADEQGRFIFMQLRVPKTLTAILAGSSLAVAGLLLQVVFRNPLAGPYVLGISSGAALVVALGVLAGQAAGISGLLAGRSLMVVCAVAGGLLMTLLILAVAGRVSNNVILLLIGLMFAQVCGAIQSSLEYFADPGSLKTFVVWGMGSVSGTGNGDLVLYAPVALAAFAALVFYVKPLNALLLGENYARTVGIDARRSRFMFILISSVLTGVTTAFCGPVAFVGIAMPILSRMLLRDAGQGKQVLVSAMLGATLVLVADTIGHSLVKGYVLPVNLITTVLGAPLVIYLMFRQKQW